MLNPSENPPPPKPSNPQYHNPDPTWSAVEEELLNLGVFAAGSICLTARDQGCGAFFIRAIIEHWKEHQPAWGLGALTERIRRARPMQDVGQNWPPARKPDPPAKSPHDRKQADQLREAEQIAVAQAKKAELERLEKDFGALLDTMSTDDREALTFRTLTDDFERTYFQRGGTVFDLRFRLLKQLESEN